MRAIETACDAHAMCRVLLTGGRSAEQLYLVWRDNPAFKRLKSVVFFFGDERCVDPDDPASNYGLAMRTLFSNGIPDTCTLVRMKGEDPDCTAESLRYERLLPNRLDVVLLGVGEDGHIASLFPGSAALDECVRKVVPVIGAKEPRARLTITPPVIANASSVFVLANGEAKASVFRRVAAGEEDFHVLPACLARNATWLLDTPC